jgi:molybdopterin molybdotransferase
MTQSSPESKVLTFQDAVRVVEEHARELRPSGTERLPLLSCARRVLAQDIAADRDFPPFARSTRDGFALRSSDIAQPPVNLRIVGEIRAGSPPEKQLPVNAGEAVEIMTGAPVPNGADSVVMLEYTERTQDAVEVKRSVSAGENVVPRGSEARRGAVLVAAGSRLDYAAIAAAASAGCAEPDVFRKPRVFVLSTGDEIVDIRAVPGPHQIRNSNTYSIAAQVAAGGGDPVLLPVAPDEPGRLRELIREGLQGDLLLLSGGVSMGKYDLVETVLAEFGARFHFTGVLIQPGKPLVFGDAASLGSSNGKRTCFFGLPGNPVSTMVTFELFVRSVLDALGGAKRRSIVFPLAKLRGTVRSKTGLTRFIPAILGGLHGRAEVELAGWHGSGDLAATARANCYAVIGPEVTEIADGELVPVLLRGLDI